MTGKRRNFKYTMSLDLFAKEYSYHHPPGGPHIITVKTEYIPKIIYKKLVNMIESSSDYTFIEYDTPEYKRFMEAAHAIVSSYKLPGAEITDSQIIGLRSSVIKNKVIKRFSFLQRGIHNIAAEYARGVGILTLSQTYDFPPMHLLRAIFTFRGEGEKFNGDIEKKLSGRDLEQYKIAREKDITTGDHDLITAKEAAAAEFEFVKRIRALGIPLKDQDELTAEQELQYGRAVITPDILFIEPVRINNADVYWIDYKNYIGSDIDFLHKSNSKQSARYNAKFGPGAFAYSGGVVAGVQIPGAIMIDARAFM